jgi:hypothetical protein
MKRVFGIFFLMVTLLSVNGQTSIPKAQAMFIYNFSRLIEWPSSYKSGPFVVGVIGSSPTYNELKSFAQGRRVGAQVIDVQQYSSAANIGKCHILFIPFSQTKLLPSVTQSLGTKSTLIITEKTGAITDGASINFAIIGNSLKFELNATGLGGKQIKTSSKLNEMAFKVY